MITAQQILESLTLVLDERNIINDEDISRYIQDWLDPIDNKDIREWVKTVVRKYILNDYSKVELVRDVEKWKGYKPWIEDAIRRGDPLYTIDLEPLFEPVERILDYLHAVYDNNVPNLPNSLRLNRLDRLPFDDAMKRAEEWRRWKGEQKKITTESPNPDEGEEKVLSLSDGHSIYQLFSRAALAREGKEMDSCVGDDDKGYADRIRRKQCEIYSLRDRAGNPLVTFDVRGGTVEQVKGYNDTAPSPKELPYVIEFLNQGFAKSWFRDIKEAELSYFLPDVILFDNRAYHIEEAPVDYWESADGQKRLQEFLKEFYKGVYSVNLSMLKSIARSGVDLTDVLIWAAERGEMKIIEALVEVGSDPAGANKNGWTPLHSAARQGNDDIVKFLLWKGADPNVVGKDVEDRLPWDLTPLQLTIPYNAQSKYSIRETSMKLLLQAGADPNVKNPQGETPLWNAAALGNSSAIAMLLKAGAEVDSLDKNKCTPLWIAAACGEYEAVQQLLDAGADPDYRSNIGTPLEATRLDKNGRVAELLRKYGAKEYKTRLP
jgi:ankyrin repeat protein